MKRKILLLIMVLLMLFAIAETVYVIFYNPDVILSLTKPQMVVSLLKYTIYILMNGMIIGIAFIGLITSRQAEKIETLLKRDEKSSINSSENEAKIKVLENKIQTLEVALENALKNSK